MILLTLLVISVSFSQEIFDKQLTIYNQVKQLIDARYGQELNFEYTMFDSQIYYSKDEKIQDLYGTLSGCVLFSAYRYSTDAMPDTFIVGMVKGGQIIWDNFPGSEKCLAGYGVYGELLYSQDLNNDGEIDLLFLQHLRTSPGDGVPFATYINILSWDGTKGKFISGEMAGSAECELIDTDGDGIKEIRTEISDMQIPGDFKTSTHPYVTYGWNGTQYGLWPSVRQVPKDELLPANRFQATVGCRLEFEDNAYKYVYSVTNKPESKQKIESFYIKNANNIISQLGPMGWSQGTSKTTGSTVFDIDIDKRRFMIKQGFTLSGFTIKSKVIPTIVKYYMLGYNGTVCCERDEQYSQNIYNNSITGYTLGTRDTSVTFGAVEWCDTLSNYGNQSFTLGWIKTQSIRDKYLNYFASVKTKLVQRDSVGARFVLLQVLKDVDIDSIASISSEAYALLRYNTEYLANRLPQAQAAPFFAIKLVSSIGTKLTSGALQYYEGAWKDATNNQDGTFSINTSLKTLSLRMTYEYGTQTKSNVSISNDTIVFQTVNAQIQLQNSSGNLIDTGSVQYYAGAWRILGTTTNGVASKELLPGNYTFRMTYAYASKDKQQDVGTNATVIFQTVNANVQLQNSQGSLMDQGSVQYYSGAWRDFGNTTNGIAIKELLPNSYTFRMTYAFATKDKQQDLNSNTVVVFQTVKSTVQLQNSQGNFIDQGTVQYYSGAWRDFGITSSGITTKELLPNSYTFRMTYAFASKDKQQDVSISPTVIFQTVNTTIQLRNSQGNLIDQGTVQYYSGAWRDFGTTTNGISTKELLPNSYTFRMTYAFASNDKQQDVGTNNTVTFSTVNATVQLQNSQGTFIDQGTVQYYSGAWRDLGVTSSGIATKELLPNNYTFRMTYAFASNDKQQNIGTNATVLFKTVNAVVQLLNSQGNSIDQGTVQYYSGAWRNLGTTANGVTSKELLPNSYSFRMTYEFVSNDKTQDVSANSTVSFSSVLCTIKVMNSQSQPVDNAQASYYSGAWRQIGTTVNGIVTKELLPSNLTFRIKSGTTQLDKAQNLSTNNVVEFSIQP
jgi:hypothetical protein